MINHVILKLGNAEIAISNDDENAVMEKAISILTEAGFIREGRQYFSISGPFEPYNGWPNYETWDVKLWIDNDEGLYHHCNELVRNAGGRAGAADALRETFEEMDPCAEKASVYTDLMGHALRGRVDWFRIADSIAEGIGRVWK